ncbi:MAPEG family protein [Alteromonas gilva]|uniref:MAPEG family protein n=1 Tax=Alteromonas gilva TaxID=2987522 RepID=A0ABT5L582_9ALTE|nr:MAPEG family protein [Alteromonas gilva]MDC8832219.1 MAPEG family protein [Alteromonas gilva]
MMIYAMFSMAMLTILVGLIVVKVRVQSVKSGQLRVGYFKLMQGDKAPEAIIKTTRCFNNLFEIPVLFYVVCTLYVSLGIHSMLALTAAWLFVLCRYAQAYIHITYNHVGHRMYTFAGSVLCMCILWINLVINV